MLSVGVDLTTKKISYSQILPSCYRSHYTSSKRPKNHLGVKKAQKDYESIIPKLPELIPFILEQCKADKQVLIQQIAYWSLARFSNWYYTGAENGE